MRAHFLSPPTAQNTSASLLRRKFIRPAMNAQKFGHHIELIAANRSVLRSLRIMRMIFRNGDRGDCFVGVRRIGLAGVRGIGTGSGLPAGLLS
jgi:hypothetical protein